MDSCPACRRQSDNPRTLAREVVGPGMYAGIEKRGDLTSVWVNTGEIRALVEVTVVACQSEICGVIVIAMLLGDDVLDVESRLIVGLANQTILTAVPRPLSDEGSGSGIH